MESNTIGKGDIYEYTLEEGNKCTYEVSRFDDDIIIFLVTFPMSKPFETQLYDDTLDSYIKKGVMKLIKKG